MPTSLEWGAASYRRDKTSWRFVARLTRSPPFKIDLQVGDTSARWQTMAPDGSQLVVPGHNVVATRTDMGI